MINRRNRYCLNKTVIMTKIPESFGYFKIQSGQL